MDVQDLLAKVYELLALYGMKVIGAAAILVIGRWVAKGLTRLLQRILNRSNQDPTLVGFISHLSYVALLVFVVIAALNQLGIQTASFIAVLGAAGLAIGLALQGSLSNFAAGVLMIIFKPFKVGDYIEGAGVGGTVEAIQMFTTLLKSPDNRTIVAPNAKVMGDTITNYTTKGTRRVEVVVGIGYGDDIDKARRVIEDIAKADQRVLEEPAPVVVVSGLADSSVNMTLRAWSRVEDYWNVYFDTIEKVKKRFDAEGISIPFPQRDVHVHEHKAL